MAFLPQGVLTGSDFFFYTPSQMAVSQLYYFTSAGRFFCESDYSVARKDYKNYLIAYIERGTLQIRTEGKVYAAHKGDVVFLNCHKPHAYWPMDSVDFTWLHIDGQNTAELHRIITEQIYDSQVFRLKDNKEFLKKMMNIIFQMRYNQVNAEFNDSLEIYGLLTAMLTDAQKNVKKTSDTLIDGAIHYMEDHLQETISVSDIAAFVGLSESHFTRKFREATGASPKDYLIRRRLTRAKLLLRTTEDSVKTIAFQVGFNSESHFSNTFTSLNGMSPKEFRKFKL